MSAFDLPDIRQRRAAVRPSGEILIEIVVFFHSFAHAPFPPFAVVLSAARSALKIVGIRKHLGGF
jgi:hypothetical protein